MSNIADTGKFEEFTDTIMSEMQRSFFLAREAITYRVSAEHGAVYPRQERLPDVFRPWWLARASTPAGGLLSTLNDLLSYARDQLGDGRSTSGERLLAEPTLKSMRSQSVSAGINEWMAIICSCAKPTEFR